VSNQTKQNIDAIIVFLVLKKLVTPIMKTQAYKLGLVDKVGKLIRKPSTEQEKENLTLLDVLIFKLKRLLGGKIGSLNRFLYLINLNTDMYSKLNVKGVVTQRAEILKITKDFSTLQENYELDIKQILEDD
jgi:hypothetical protein